jgi:DNA repair protein RecN (Recombination protein N)
MQISDVIPEFASHAEVLRDFMYQIDDIAEKVYQETSELEEDCEDTINSIESRLDKISKLKRKYGLTIKDILEFREKASNELDTLEDSEAVLKKLQKEENAAYSEALELAKILHQRRVDSAKIVETEVKKSLEFLDMPKVVFFASIKNEESEGRTVLYPDGMDSVEFYISANRGVDALPLSKVASGGELARVMLSIKSVIADKDGVSTVIFDEIDAGVSGKTARKIGVKMLSLSKNTQMFAVTHSAQIASLADKHLLISKSDVDGATQTSVKLLDYDGRVAELSRILGGIAVTDAQRRAAIDMISERETL